MPMSATPAAPPTFSITVSTIMGWPDLVRTLPSLEAAAERVGGEVIVTDGSRAPAPDRALLRPTTTWLKRPGLSVFQLREIGYRLARAPIVAVTEDEIVRAMRLLWERLKVVVEPSGAVPFAAVLNDPEQFRGRRVGVVLSGGNLDLERPPWQRP